MGMCCAIKVVNPSAAGDALRQRSTSLSLEKAWHGLHYLLTGSAAEGDLPLAFLLQGGEEVGEDDSYGPPRLFSPDEVEEIDAALSAISDDQLWSRFDPEQMSAEGVYPDCWDEPEQDLREEYLSYFHEMKKIVSLANTRGDALLVLLT
jgi:Domain of unknown function (DUF1877)